MDPFARDILNRAYTLRRAAQRAGDDDLEEFAHIIEDLTHLYARGHDPPEIPRRPRRYVAALRAAYSAFVKELRRG